MEKKIELKLREFVISSKAIITKYNYQTKAKGEFLSIPMVAAKNFSEIETAWIKENKALIIAEIKVIEAEKIQAEIEKNNVDFERMVKENAILNLIMFFTNCGSGVAGLPENLKDKENIVKKLHFSIDENENFFLTITISDLIAAIQKKENEIKNENDKKETIKKEHYEKCLAVAIETKQPVILNSWSIECQDSREECNMDIVTEYVNPDGKITRTIGHTY